MSLCLVRSLENTADQLTTELKSCLSLASSVAAVVESTQPEKASQALWS